jgi:hypothetical protein
MIGIRTTWCDQDGCEVPIPPGWRCGRQTVGYINDGVTDAHVCATHWLEYHERTAQRVAHGDVVHLTTYYAKEC